MRNKVLAATTIIALALASLAFAQTAKSVAWEYHVEFHGTISEKKLNELGVQGWELTGTQTDIKNGNSAITSFYFKRIARPQP